MSNPWFLELRRRPYAVLLCCLALLTAPHAHAQLALPGATAPTAEGALAPPAADASGAKSKPRPRGDDEAGPAVAPKPPSEDGVIGKPLYLDGTRSVIELRRADGKLQVARLTLTGDSISRSGESCRVEMSGTPLSLTPRDDDSGLHRFKAELPACPFTLQVLDGAVFVTNEGGACELKSADCRSDPVGLWGAAESEFDTKRAKEMLGMRARVEKTVRASFHALYAKYKTDRDMRKYLVRVQVAFPAHREEICRSYVKEEDVGYCSLRLTEARALTLGTQLAHGVTRPANLAADEAAPVRLRRVGR